MSLLEFHDVHKSFGAVRALRGVSFTVTAGEAHACIGENGAGKSTLLKAIFGSLRPSSGHVLLDGNDVTSVPAHAMVRAGAAFVPQTDNVFPRLSIRENLE
ncbi:MAG TPA: ATP-binding cassette domain-containing protein, partial [Vicinamibacterales bacterium]